MVRRNFLKLISFGTIYQLIILFIIIFNLIDAEKICNPIRNKCLLKTYYNKFLETDMNKYVCSKLNQNFTIDLKWKLARKENEKCIAEFGKKIDTIFYDLTIPTILDHSKFNLREIDTFFDTINFKYVGYYLEFEGVKGFDINSIYALNSFRFMLSFFSSRLNFFSNHRLIRTCADLENIPVNTIFHTRRFNTSLVDSTMPSIFEVEFNGNKPSNPICPLIFHNVSVQHFILTRFIDSFYKSNVIKFLPILNDTQHLTNQIQELKLSYYDIPTINSSLLNPIVFKSVIRLVLFGQMRSIETGLLRNFEFLEQIMFNIFYFIRMCHHGCIDWIKDLNHDVNVNLANLEKDIDQNKIDSSILNNSKCILLNSDDTFYKSYMNENLNKVDEIFPEEDFCIYSKFPFNQLVFIEIYYKNMADDSSKSCTLLWLFQYLNVYEKKIEGPLWINETFFKVKRKECEFQKRYNTLSNNKIIFF